MSRPTIPLSIPGAVLAVLFLATPAFASPADGGRTPADPGAGEPARLVAVRAAHHPGFDRLVFQFAGRVPDIHAVAWTDQLWQDRAGPARRAWVSGNAFLRIRLFPVLGEPRTDATADRAFQLPELVEARRIGDWEGYQTWGIGLMRRTSLVHVTTLASPPRLVVDVAAPFATTRARILLLDVPADRWTWVSRPVPAATGVVARARDVLRRLFAGPTPAERAAGLRLVRDHVVSFRALSVTAAGVLRVTLVGSCDADGAARTLGPELVRTLRSVPGVRWVKVRDEHGATAHPDGPRDSLPACLAP